VSTVRLEDLRDRDDAPRVTAERFRSVFRDHAARVAIVTARSGGSPAGFTATSLSSVSLQPPMVSFAISSSASAWATFSRSRRIAVHLLSDDQDWLAARFATSGIERFADVRWHPGPAGEPVIEDCAALLHCHVTQHVPAGDHVLVVARVTRADLARSGAPLMYHDGAFTSIGTARDTDPTDADPADLDPADPDPTAPRSPT
jgi:flavin reductase (DIM6/NTAB) family NADH-FMN oxidoreductase RutF